MNQKEEKWAIFWCDLLSPIIYARGEPEQTLKQIADTEVVFPDGKVKKPSLSTLKRKLKKYQQGGFNNLLRKPRNNRGKPRGVSDEVISKAIELKKEQGRRSHITINRFIEHFYGLRVPRSTLYWHLKQAGATRLKLGISKQKVRGRFTREHTHDLWIGDFEEGPYVIEKDEIIPTYLSGFIDCHSRFIVEARYYFRQSLDILIDSLIRALAKHGAPLAIYLDNAKVYHSHGLRMACHKMSTRLIHRPKGDPPPGGLIEKFFQTVQNQFEAEVRAGHIMTLHKLNQAFSAWLAVSYHQEIHSETGQPPEKRYQSGLRTIRQIDMEEILSAFMQRVNRRVNTTFSDVRINNRYYKLDTKLRGDRVQVAFDPFSSVDKVEIYSLQGVYLGSGKQHFREPGSDLIPIQNQEKPKHNYLDLLLLQHKKQLDEQTKTIDYRKLVSERPWPFHEFVKTFAQLLGKKGGLSAFNAQELEKLKKVYNHDTSLNKKTLKLAFEKAPHPSMTYVIHELKRLLKQKEVS